MASELKKQLTERFVKGIRKSFAPCPLIGPKWLQEFPKGRPADFRFFGIRKLSKAIGQPPQRILKTVMRNVSFKGLDVEVEITGGIYVDIFLKGKPRAKPRKRPQTAVDGDGAKPKPRIKKPFGKPRPFRRDKSGPAKSDSKE